MLQVISENVDLSQVAVCFEQFISWPAFQTALEEPDVVLAPANLWFANGTNLNAVREVTEFCDDGVNQGGDLLCLNCTEFQICLDGDVKGTEECDDSGWSATCDADCTPPICGDNKPLIDKALSRTVSASRRNRQAVSA